MLKAFAKRRTIFRRLRAGTSGEWASQIEFAFVRKGGGFHHRMKLSDSYDSAVFTFRRRVSASNTIPQTVEMHSVPNLMGVRKVFLASSHAYHGPPRRTIWIICKLFEVYADH